MMRLFCSTFILLVDSSLKSRRDHACFQPRRRVARRRPGLTRLFTAPNNMRHPRAARSPRDPLPAARMAHVGLCSRAKCSPLDPVTATARQRVGPFSSDVPHDHADPSSHRPSALGLRPRQGAPTRESSIPTSCQYLRRGDAACGGAWNLAHVGDARPGDSLAPHRASTAQSHLEPLVFSAFLVYKAREWHMCAIGGSPRRSSPDAFTQVGPPVSTDGPTYSLVPPREFES